MLGKRKEKDSKKISKQAKSFPSSSFHSHYFLSYEEEVGIHTFLRFSGS
jgi:hypothetical protein